jgi:dipeptidyl aminopeptidase/acylaminoacyl peptidase
MHHIAFSSPITYLARKWSGLDLRRVNPTKTIEKVTTPIFLIHSKSDKFIPMKAFHKLKNAGKSIEKTWTPQDGKHTELLAIHPNEYAQHCQEFLTEIHSKSWPSLEFAL